MLKNGKKEASHQDDDCLVPLRGIAIGFFESEEASCYRSVIAKTL